MAISGEDLVKMTTEEIRRIFGEDNCPRCNHPFDTHHDEIQYISNGVPVCSDCYFEEFGRELDKYPIGHPNTTGARGCGAID